MLKSIVNVAIAQRWLLLLVAAAVAAAGALAIRGLPIDAFPDIAPTQVKIILKAPGMTPEEVEAQIVAPLEAELLGIPKQAILRSTVKYAIADVTVNFIEGVDIYWARQQVAERLANVRDVLPATVSGGLAPISTPLSDVIMFTLEGGGLNLEQRRSLLDWTIRPALRGLPGVARERLTAGDLAAAVERANRNDGAGRLDQGEQALIVREVGAIRTVEDVKETIVPLGDGRSVRLGDLAEVQLGALTRYGAVTKDGSEAAEAIVLTLKGADASAVIRSVQGRLAELQPSLPKGVKIGVFYDRSDLIERAVGTVVEALAEASLFVVVLLFLFLGNVRAAIVVAVTLPMAVVMTALCMRAAGMSANLMSLGGLAIAIGMLVDGAVVVVENTVERLAHGPANESRIHAVAHAAKEVALPVSAGVLIICLVFAPLLSLQGLEGKMFAPVALTIVFALAASLLLSLTLIPALSSLTLKQGPAGQGILMRWIEPAYQRLLGGALQRPRIVYAVAAVGVIAAAAAYTQVGKSFMPTMDEGSIVMQLTKLPSINLDRSANLDQSIEQEIRARVPEVRNMICRVGSDELGLDPMSPNESDCFLALAPKKEWRKRDKPWLEEQVRQVMTSFPGVEISFTQPIEMRTSEMLTGARGALAIKIFGPDLAVLSKLAGQVQASVGKVPGAKDVFTVANDAVDYLQVDIDRSMLGRYGLGVDQLQDELRAQLEGRSAGLVREPDRRTPIIVRGPPALRSQPDAFDQIQIATPDGGTVHLSDVARLERQDGPVKIDRENASRFGVVQSNVEGRDLVGFVKDAQAAVARDVPLPTGYRLSWGGAFENQQRAAARLAAVVPVALALIFLVVFLTLGSLRQTALIVANIPFAVVGGMLSLWASGEFLSVPASVGFIALLGIAVLNGLVLISYFNTLWNEGRSIDFVVNEGAKRRLRPVLMTASITAIGLVPLLFASGPGSEIQRPLAVVVVGGLISSTALTLLLLPILYRRFGISRAEAERERAPEESLA